MHVCQCVSVSHKPGADRHFHWGINAVTGCLVANFLLQHCLGFSLFSFFFGREHTPGCLWALLETQCPFFVLVKFHEDTVQEPTHLFTKQIAACDANSQFQLNPVTAARQKAKVAGVHVPWGRRGSAQAEWVGVACEFFSQEKVISPMSYISRHNLAW